MVTASAEMATAVVNMPTADVNMAAAVLNMVTADANMVPAVAEMPTADTEMTMIQAEMMRQRRKSLNSFLKLPIIPSSALRANIKRLRRSHHSPPVPSRVRQDVCRGIFVSRSRNIPT